MADERAVDDERASGERCERCDGRDTVDRRYSYGVYAGVLCELCAKSCYRDQCGLRPEGQGTGADYEELAGPGTYDGEDPDWY